MKEKIYDEVIETESEEYIIKSEIDYENEHYLYVESETISGNYMILREIEEDGEYSVEGVDLNLHNILLPLFNLDEENE